ncbi:hypothetical protein [Clostridium cylindrosporum]|uniref:Collagen triple helix repeat protein n=1 Tax=Clostridium cylindrosporum DSM 605 TaxID=1121307 RepID=A0A0J8DAB5_CLOCY|nr:hypothetical protein [Clostridium cylindrosporum]KMT22792.1 hypothetical protein CLCY_5c00310 [Clostridium cylindrosporum DSM 605]
MSNIKLQLERTIAEVSVEVNNTVIFDTNPIVGASNVDDVNYDPTTGLITLNQPGEYKISWFVAIQSSLGVKGPEFAIVTSDMRVYTANTAVRTGQISDFALITVPEGGLTIKLVNRSSGLVVYAKDVSVTASLSILKAPEKGATGPKGNTGPMGAASLGGLELQLAGYSGANLSDTAVVPFDTIYTNLTTNISNSGGNIQITAAGRYMIDWWIGLSGSGSTRQVSLKLLKDGNEVGISYVYAQFACVNHGNTIVDITQADIAKGAVTIKLINNSGASLTLSQTTRQGSIRIVKITNG